MQSVALVALLDMFFTLPSEDAKVGCDLFERNKRQIDALLDLYDFARESRVIKPSLIPSLTPQPDELLESIRRYADTGELPSSSSSSGGGGSNVNRTARDGSDDGDVPTTDLREILPEHELSVLNDTGPSEAPSENYGNISDLLFADDVVHDEDKSSDQGATSMSAMQAADVLFGDVAPTTVAPGTNNAMSDPFATSEGSNTHGDQNAQKFQPQPPPPPPPSYFQPYAIGMAPGAYQPYGYANPFGPNPYGGVGMMLPQGPAGGGFYDESEPGIIFGPQVNVKQMPRANANASGDKAFGRPSLNGNISITSVRPASDNETKDPFADLL